MTRTDNDTWDLASSVGATATLVAAARAAASRETDPLIDDPFAEPLVRAVGIDFFTRMATGGLPTPDDQTAMGVSRLTDNMAVRTKFFDEFFLAGARAVAIGTATFVEPRTALNVIEGIGRYLDAKGFKSINDIVGALKV